MSEQLTLLITVFFGTAMLMVSLFGLIIQLVKFLNEKK